MGKGATRAVDLNIAGKLMLGVKWLLYPGMNLHARARYGWMDSRYETRTTMGDWQVLDAGCGNGMLAYKACLQGKYALGISIKESEVRKCRELFNDYLQIDRARLRFECENLYSLESWAPECFDEIVCSEVLEHLRGDTQVCAGFYKLLRPGGVLHVCAPNAEHPYNRTFPLDYEEKGGHVRPGYTEESYRELFEPLGFEVEQVVGLGGPIRQGFNRRIKEIQSRFGAMAGLPLFLIALAVLPFERRDVDPPMPFSIYAKVRKPLEPR